MTGVPDQPAADTAAGEHEQTTRRPRRWPWVVAFMLLFSVFVAAGAFAGATKSYADSLQGRLLPGTTIAGASVGGMTHEQALAAVEDALADELDRRIVVRWGEQRWRTTARELGPSHNAQEIIAEVAQSQAGLSWRDWAELRWFGEQADSAADVEITYRAGATRRFVEGIAAEVDLDAQDATLEVNQASIEITPERIGRKVNQRRAVAAIQRRLHGEGKRVKLRVRDVQPAATRDDFSQVLLLDQSDHELTLFLDGRKHKSWIVAVGTGEFPTPLGRYEVTLKRYMPTWVNPAPTGWGKSLPASIPPGRSNPLGVRALNWDAPAIRFHGTQAVDSLGTDASHGCVRMSNKDVTELYDLVDVGAVIISRA